jgi:hypothetical protein
MEDCPWRFKKIYKGIQGFCTSLAAIGPLTSMLEDEQSFKHGGGLLYQVLCCLKVWRSTKNEWKIKKIKWRKNEGKKEKKKKKEKNKKMKKMKKREK